MVKTKVTPYPIRYMPEGWAETRTKFGRNMKHFGLIRSYSDQYKFVRDAAFIIRSVAYGTNYEGTETQIFFVTNRWNPETGVHEFYSRAEIDLTQIQDDPFTGVTVNLIEGGVSKIFKAREGQVYDIQCNETNPDAKLITNDGVELTALYRWSFVEGLITLPGITTDTAATFIIPMAFLGYEGKSVGIATSDPTFEILNDWQHGSFLSPNPQWTAETISKLITSASYVIWSAYLFTQRIRTSVLISGNNTGGAAITLMWATSLGRVWNAGSNFIPDGGTIQIDIDFTVTLFEGEKLFLLGYTQTPGDPNFTFHRSEMTSDFNTRNPVSTCWALSAYDLWKQLCLIATDGKYNGESALLASLQHIMVTCGDALRGIPTAVIKTSINDFSDKSFMKILGGAVGIDYETNNILFERKEFWFDNTNQIIDLGEVADLEISYAPEFSWSSVKIGWPAKDATDSLGKQEFNDTKNFTLPITRTPNQLDLVSAYRSDIFIIEQIRTDYFAKDKTATAKDNDVFIINTMQDGDLIVPRRVNYASITGGANVQTWYNIELLTPARMLRTNSSYIGIPLYAQQSKLVKFTGGIRNENLVTVYANPANDTIVEKESLQVNDLKKADPDWPFERPAFAFPWYFKFKTKVPVNFTTLIQQNNGYITFSVNGNVLKGFPMDMAQLPVYNEPQEWKLLCSSLTDLPTLIALQDIYNINGPGMISHKLPLKFVAINPVYSEQFHFHHMDTDWHSNRIGRYSQRKPFAQKMQTDDNTPLTFITNGTSMNNIVIYNCKGTIVDQVVPTNLSNAAIRLPWQLWHGIIDWSIIPPNETYYVKISFGVGEDKKEFISEPIHLKVKWPHTLLLQATHYQNHRDMIFRTTDPFVIKLRFEGMIQKFEPKSNIVTYEDETLDIETLSGEPYRQWELFIGDEIGTPDWLIDKINRILLLSDITIDNYAYSVDKGAKLERIGVQGSPYAYWGIIIREKNNRPGIDIEESGLNRIDLTVQYDISTAGFSSDQHPNNDQQDNIIQITDIE